jgi:hypothetical protein
MGRMRSPARRVVHSLTGLVFATLCCLAVEASAQWAEPIYGEAGDWVVPPAVSNEPEGSRIGTGSCAFELGRPGVFTARLTVHAYTPEIYKPGPDHTWTRPGNREQDWRRWFTETPEGSYLEVSIDYICATSPDTDIEFFYTDWYAFSIFDDGPQINCPSHKPVLLAARCLTRTW